MSFFELFSPIGICDLRRAIGLGTLGVLEGEDPLQGMRHYVGVSYYLTEMADFRQPDSPHQPIRAEGLPDTLAEAPELACKEVPAFAAHCDGQEVSRSTVWWDPDVPYEIGVHTIFTDKEHRGKGYGAAVVAATTKWILAQGAIAAYGALWDNIPALRYVRRMGYKLSWWEV